MSPAVPGLRHVPEVVRILREEGGRYQWLNPVAWAEKRMLASGSSCSRLAVLPVEVTALIRGGLRFPIGRTCARANWSSPLLVALSSESDFWQVIELLPASKWDRLGSNVGDEPVALSCLSWVACCGDGRQSCRPGHKLRGEVVKPAACGRV